LSSRVKIEGVGWVRRAISSAVGALLVHDLEGFLDETNL